MEYNYLDDTKNITDLFDNNLNSENINNKTKNSEVITNEFTEDIKIINLEKPDLNKNINPPAVKLLPSQTADMFCLLIFNIFAASFIEINSFILFIFRLT